MEVDNSSNLQVTEELKNICPVTATLVLIGGRWKAGILYYLELGPKRFGEIHVRLSGISRKVLTDQLKELEKDGLVKRASFKEVPPRVEYSLTDFGHSLTPVFKSIVQWANENLYNDH